MGKTPADQLAELESKINEFISESRIFLCVHDDKTLEIAGLTYQEIKELSQEECLIASLKLQEHCSCITREINTLKAKMSWVSYAINKLVSDNHSSFGKYDKHDQKIFILQRENILAGLLIEARQAIESRLLILDDVVCDYRMMANKFGELARIK